jgi:predicted transcriptional regulator
MANRKNAPIGVRLNEREEAALDRLAERLSLPRSEILRRSIRIGIEVFSKAKPLPGAALGEAGK